MRRIIENTGVGFQRHLTTELLDLLYKSCRHPNRFVRETSYHTLAAVCSISPASSVHQLGYALAEVLQDGLSENWSQVRSSPLLHAFACPLRCMTVVIRALLQRYGGRA